MFASMFIHWPGFLFRGRQTVLLDLRLQWKSYQNTNERVFWTNIEIF